MFKNKWKYRIISFAAGIFMLLAVQPLRIHGAQNAGAVTIEYHGRTEDDTKINLQGAQFVLYEVGCLQDGKWTISETFHDTGVSLDSQEASDRKKQAEKLYAYAVKKKLQGTIQKTDASGIAVFENLEEGLYLIAQKEKLSYGESEFFTTPPFLISIPAEVDGKETYGVTVEPKSEWGKPEKPEKPGITERPEKPEKPGITEKPEKPGTTEKPSEPGGNVPQKSEVHNVKTGDNTPIERLVITLLTCTGIMCGLFIPKKRFRCQK